MSAFLDQYWKVVSPEPNSGCWIWLSEINYQGYGRVRLASGKTTGAHRLAVEIDTGKPVPPQLHVDHLCRVRCCVNPDHLEVVTQRENTYRAMRFRDKNLIWAEGHCVHGHLMDEYNTHRRRSAAIGGGEIIACRTCEIISRRKYRAKNRKPRTSRRKALDILISATSELVAWAETTSTGPVASKCMTDARAALKFAKGAA